MPKIALQHSDKNPQSAANHSLIDELIAAVATGGVKQRLRILQRITDLFVAGTRSYSTEQIALFDDVLQELAADIEVKARAKLAQRLADVSGAPPKLIRSLAFDDAIEVAGPVLVHSEQLSDDDLVENVRSKSQAHLFAIAKRLKLSEAVTDVLVERGDRRVLHKVAGNRGARFSLAGYERLSDRARRDRRLTLTLAQRSDIPRQYLIRLLDAASATVRAKLEAANPQAAAAIRDSVDEVARAMQKGARQASQEYNAAARDVRRRFETQSAGEVNVHAPARAQQFNKVVISLAKLGRFPVEMVERALLDDGNEMLIVLAKAADCSWTTTRELLLMQTAGRNLTPDDLRGELERYRTLSRETARSIINFRERRIKMQVQETRAGSKARPAAAAPVPIDILAARRAGLAPA
jgi:uncharacterized protein (DUF2336 family)